MQTVSISLPDPLKEFVDGQVAEGRYSSVSEYIRELIHADEKRADEKRADEKRKAEDRLEALLQQGLESEETDLTGKDFEDIRSEGLALLKARNK